MKSKRCAVIISGMIFILNFLVYTILFWRWYPSEIKHLLNGFNTSMLREYICNITLGILTGAIVSAILSFSEYLILRREAIENYYSLCNQFLKNFHGLKYLHIDPSELLENYYQEIENNQRIKSGKRLKSGENEIISHDAKNKLMDWIWENGYKDRFSVSISEEERKKELKKELKKRVIQYEDEMDCVMQQYIEIAKLQYDDIERAYREFAFFTFDIKKMIYEPIQEKQREMLKYIRINSNLFVEYYNGDYGINRIQIMQQIYWIQNTLYDTYKMPACDEVYVKFCYDVTCSLEELLKFICKKKYKDLPVTQKEFCVCEVNSRLKDMIERWNK